MERTMNKKMEKILRRYLGFKRMQKIYVALFRFSLVGMNYGNTGNFKESGELNVLKYIKANFKKSEPITVFDVGGNVGNYSKSLANFFENNATIHAFELFLENTSRVPNIIPNNFGFGDVEKTLLLYTNSSGSGLASVYHRNLEHYDISMDMQEEIKIATIDSYCKINNVDRIHFLKLDIEGNELNALKGAGEMMKDNRIDFIQFEFGGCNIDSRTYFQDFFYLLKDKYRVYRILKDGLFEIEQYKELFEIFLTVNYLAERKK